jgi:predicted outer membrane protein
LFRDVINRKGTTMTVQLDMPAWCGRKRLDDLLTELQRQRQSKVDVVVDTRRIYLDDEGRLLPADAQTGEWLPTEGVRFRDDALAQLGQRLTVPVPVKFAKQMNAEQPVINAQLFNALMAKSGRRVLVRILDDRVRAVLSDAYKMLDYYDTAFTCLDAAREHGGEVLDASLSEDHLRMTFIARDAWDTIHEDTRGRHEFHRFGAAAARNYRESISLHDDGGELPGGKGTVYPAVRITTSETGRGAMTARAGYCRAYCLNTSIMWEVSREVHLGGRLEAGLYSQETREADARAIMLKARDLVANCFKADVFRRMMQQVKDAAAVTIEAPAAAVGVLCEENGISDDRKNSLLQHFLGEFDANAYGLSQAVARVAQDETNPDKAETLERLAGSIITKPQTYAKVTA